jgi:hypothetical protein
MPSVSDSTTRLATELATGPAPVRLTIGFANLVGTELDALVSEDVAVLAPLFAQSRVVPAPQLPGADILFVYAQLDADGSIVGATRTGIRQVAQLANAAIVVLASPNTAASIKNAASLSGPKTSNIVFTLDRNGPDFGKFFCELFGKMRDGQHMLTAWAALAPKGPKDSRPSASRMILLAEGGKIAFPR